MSRAGQQPDRPRHALECQLSSRVPSARVQAEMRAFYATNESYAHQQASHPPEYFARLAGVMQSVLATPRQRVLEIGAGWGGPLRTWLAGSPGSTGVALELSSTSLRAYTHDRGAGLSGVAGDALHLPFLDGAFDAVVAFEVVEHLPDVEQACREMLRVIRPRGFVVIGLPNHASLWTPMEDALLRRTRGAFGVVRGRGAWRWWFRNLRLTVRKRLSPGVDFLYRAPIYDVGRGGDWDAVYYAAPLDLVRFFRRHEARMVTTSIRERMGWLGRMVPLELQGSAVMAWRPKY